MSVRRVLFLAAVCLGLLVSLTILGSDSVRFEGHTRDISKVISSRDGTILATLSNDDKTITLSDQATGEERARLEGDKFAIFSMAFSPDGKTLVLGGTAGIRLWDAATGKERHGFVGQGNEIQCVAFSPDGKTLASGQWMGSLWLWDVASGKRRFLEEPSWLGDNSVDWPDYVAFSPDGKTLAAIVEHRLGLWDVKSGKHTATLERGRSVTFTTNGKLVALLENDKTVKIREMAPVRVKAIGILCALGAVALVILAATRSLRSISRRGAVYLAKPCLSTVMPADRSM